MPAESPGLELGVWQGWVKGKQKRPSRGNPQQDQHLELAGIAGSIILAPGTDGRESLIAAAGIRVVIKTEELLPEDSPENPELHGMSGQSEGSFQSPDEEAACESPYSSVSPQRDLPGTSLGDSSEYGADFNEIQRVIVHHGSCTGEMLREWLCTSGCVRDRRSGGLWWVRKRVGWTGGVKSSKNQHQKEIFWLQQLPRVALVSV